jgi:hypothetical protein
MSAAGRGRCSGAPARPVTAGGSSAWTRPRRCSARPGPAPTWTGCWATSAPSRSTAQSWDVIDPGGAVVSAANTSPRLVASNVVEVVGRFSSPGWERDVLCPSRLRFTGADALDALLARAGLTVGERYGRWDRSPFRPDAPEIITIAAVS